MSDNEYISRSELEKHLENAIVFWRDLLHDPALDPESSFYARAQINAYRGVLTSIESV